MKAFVAIAAVAALATSVVAMRGIESGLKPGESVSPFHPKHLSGPLAGTDKCFPCTYKAAPQVQVWVNHDSVENCVKIANELQRAMDMHKAEKVQAMMVFVGMSKDCPGCLAHANEVIEKSDAKDVQFSVVGKDDEAVKAYKINLDKSVKNTVIAYKGWKVVTNVANVEGAAKDTCGSVCKAVDSLLQ
jgi:bacterioferritin-associated ferredoxin